jgi:hypothetical protein
MQMQLGPQMQTSTPIHSTFAQSNAPHILVNGQGQGHVNTQTTTTNQDTVYSVRLSVSKFPSSRKFSAPIVVKHTNKTTTDQSYKTGDHSYPPY